MEAAETAVGGENLTANRQDLHVTMSYPGDLEIITCQTNSIIQCSIHPIHKQLMIKSEILKNFGLVRIIRKSTVNRQVDSIIKKLCDWS